MLFATSVSHAATFNLKDRLKSLQGSQDFKAHEAAVIEAGNLIKRQPRQMDGTWEKKQIATILDFVFVEKDPVYRQQMIEMAVVHFKDNRKAIGDFVKASKSFTEQEAKDLLYDIDAMIHQSDRGQDPRK